MDRKPYPSLDVRSRDVVGVEKESRRMSKRTRGVLPALIVLLLATACGGSTEQTTGTSGSGTESDASAVADFYDGKTVKIIVATKAGGGFDTYARVIAKHLGKHIPGEPNIIVENMPGAGHMLAMNHLYNQAPKDGTVIGNATGGLALQQLFESPRVQFDMREFNYLGLPDPIGNSVLIARSGVVKNFEELLKPGAPELVVGVQSPGSLQTDPATLLKEVLGANLKLVSGYDGSSAINLAMEQGEVDAFVTSWHTELATTQEKFKSGEWTVLVQYEREPDPTIDEFVEDVPTVYDFTDNESEEELLFYGSGPPRSLTRIYFLPPDVPEDRVAAVRQAWDDTMKDPDFLADAEKVNLLIGGLSGQEVEEGIKALLNLPPELRSRLEPLIGGKK
jgi:tripartite-type tricarboxylate transporter receptor subunit TctC